MTVLTVLVLGHPCEVCSQTLYFTPPLIPNTGNAAEPAGIEGMSSHIPAAPAGAVSGWDDQTVPPPVVLPTRPQPFYKRRWFIVSQIIIIPLGIALLFIVLFPVVRAIVELVVKRTNLDVQLAVITQPVNNSSVSNSFLEMNYALIQLHFSSQVFNSICMEM